jgi:hypothetical protein
MRGLLRGRTRLVAASVTAALIASLAFAGSALAFGEGYGGYEICGSSLDSSGR